MDLALCKVSLTLPELLFNSLIVMVPSLASAKDTVPSILLISQHTYQAKLTNLFQLGMRGIMMEK